MRLRYEEPSFEWWSELPLWSDVMDLTLRAWGLGYPERRLSTILAGTTSLSTVSSEVDQPIKEIPRPKLVPLAQTLTRNCVQCGYPFKIKYHGQYVKLCSNPCRAVWRERQSARRQARRRANARKAQKLADVKASLLTESSTGLILPLPPAGATLDEMLARIAAWRAGQTWIR